MPGPNTSWPPAQWSDAFQQVAYDAAWLADDVGTLAVRYNTRRRRPVTSPYQHNGGITGAAARAWYGRPQAGQAHEYRHLPVLSTLANTSADLLVSTPPDCTVHPDDEGNEPAAAALATLTTTDRFAADLHQAMRRCAGLGWVYARIVWNQDVDESPWIEWVDADHGITEWANGRPIAHTFWDTHTVHKHSYRLLQRHTPGRIEYALYEGTDKNLGRRVDVGTIPQTEHLLDILDEDSGITTGTNRLTAVMVPNIDRNDDWRNHPQLRYYGRSDTRAGGGLWADIDSVYTDLLHEIDAARSRLLISEEFLESRGPGRGTVFDWGRDVYPLAPTADPDGRGRIERVQFEIRIAEYEQSLRLLISRALDAVGISRITVGLEQAGGQMTATEIQARSERTIKTHRAKGRMLRAGLSDILTAWLDVDATLKRYAPPTRPVNVGLEDPVQETEFDRTQSVANLRAAGAASTRYLMDRLHPEWTPEERDEEAARIQAEERGAQPYDPLTLAGPDEPLGA